jgi:hypothetical protein
MPYTAEKPRLAESSDELRARIPGWGADLDPANRPAVPRERYDLGTTGAHWELPERQPEKWPRERSIEHTQLTPVFGTAAPPHGVSGAVRRLAYARYSEARAAHWVLLVAADRIDSVGATLGALVTMRPDNPVSETGVLSELTRHGLSSRRRGRRADATSHLIDPVVVGAPWVIRGALGYLALRWVGRTLRR